MRSLHIFSKSDSSEGQGVHSAYLEQVRLSRQVLGDQYRISINPFLLGDINHFHTVNLRYYLKNAFFGRLFGKKKASIGYVHFLPETVDESLKLPKLFRKVFYWYLIQFYKSMDYHVVVNPYFIDLMAEYRIDTTNTVYIPNFVSDEEFFAYDESERDRVRASYGIEKDDFAVLGVGQTQTRKGVFDFVELARRNPDMKFFWAGGFSFGKMTDGYEEIKVLMENPPQNMTFMGIVPREKMNEIYNMADVMFLPSYAELFPMTILESMATGRAVLLRDLPIYEGILFDYYQKASDNDGFERILRRLRSDAPFRASVEDDSRRGNRFYNRESVGKMWKNFYDRVYRENGVRRRKESDCKERSV